jgi:hypothetical protein
MNRRPTISVFFSHVGEDANLALGPSELIQKELPVRGYSPTVFCTSDPQYRFINVP